MIGVGTNKWYQILMQVGVYFKQEIQPNIYSDQADNLQ